MLKNFLKFLKRCVGKIFIVICLPLRTSSVSRSMLDVRMQFMLSGSVVDYFVSNGSTVNLFSLDVSKAFDRLNHYALFSKLIDRFIPVNIILLLANWYSCCVGVVNWKGALSQQYLPCKLG